MRGETEKTKFLMAGIELKGGKDLTLTGGDLSHDDQEYRILCRNKKFHAPREKGGRALNLRKSLGGNGKSVDTSMNRRGFMRIRLKKRFLHMKGKTVPNRDPK